MVRTRLLAAASASVLVPALLVVAPGAQARRAPQVRQAHTATSPGVPLRPGDGVYDAKVTRTDHGIPHVTAGDWGSLGFGSGYAAATTDTCTLADTLLTARGERSLYLGPHGTYDDRVIPRATNVQVDALTLDLRQRRVVEKLLRDPVRGPGPRARAMVRGYVAGINHYLRSIGGADHITDPACRGGAWIRPDVKPIDLWYGIYLANLIASTGHFLPQIVGATPPSLTDPGLPLTKAQARLAAVPKKVPPRARLLKGLGQGAHFGSNATAVGRDITSTHRGMLLGNPHFPWVGRYRFTQQQLTIPGHYDVAGASLIGSPVVNIGWNHDVAWSHTVSTAYRFTPYEYPTLVSPTTYLTSKGIRHLKHDVVHVKVRKADGSVGTMTEGMYRTPQGYVIDDPGELMGWTPLSFFAIRDANAEQLRTIDTFLNMGGARSVTDLIHKQDAGSGMPWVNTIAADRAGRVLYADHSVVPHVTDAQAAKCMTPVGRVIHHVSGLPVLDGTRAEGACAWGSDADAQRPGILGPHNLPLELRTDWVMNSNDSYWLPNPKQPLTGYDRIIGCEACVRTLRTRVVDHYVLDRLASGRKVTPRSLRGTEYANRVYGAELMSRGGALVQLCRNAGGTTACDALGTWDKHSNIDSRGNQIFEEFVKRLPTSGLLGLLPAPSIWKVPFDPADPVNTPRELNPNNSAAKKAMRGALAYLRDHHIPMDATWGSLQVAGDRGAPPIPLGGGLGDQAGNANALASVDPVANTDHYKAVDFGSSHIQAVAFLPDGRVDAHTILTYGQSDNPRSPWSADQTRMFGKKEWVHFPFTPAQIRRQQISQTVVTAPARR